MRGDNWDYDDPADALVRLEPTVPVQERLDRAAAAMAERATHVNLDYGRRYRLLPREKQPDCGCGECKQIKLRKEKENALASNTEQTEPAR